MAKKRKYPKALKAGASLQSLKKQAEKVKEIKKINDAIERAKSEKVKLRETIRKMKG